jgi:hypothetical protein
LDDRDDNVRVPGCIGGRQRSAPTFLQKPLKRSGIDVAPNHVKACSLERKRHAKTHGAKADDGYTAGRGRLQIR